jgi:hypothetical protein
MNSSRSVVTTMKIIERRQEVGVLPPAWRALNLGN